MTLTRAREYVVTTTNALAEQTAEALQTASVILARTLDRVDGMDWQSIDKSRQVHEFLAKIDHELPLVQSVFLVDPEGYKFRPQPRFPHDPYDLRDREYYIESQDDDDRLYVTAAFLGQMTGVAGFTVSRPRLTNGHFDGVVVVTPFPKTRNSRSRARRWQDSDALSGYQVGGSFGREQSAAFRSTLRR